MTTHGTPRIDQAMDARRIELRLKWKDVITLAGISPQTLSKIRTYGTAGVDALIVAKVEQALRWAPGSLQALTSGGEPTPLDSRDTEPVPRPAPPTLASDPRVRALAAILETLAPDERERELHRLRKNLSEPADAPVDLTDPDERTVAGMNVDEDTKRAMIEALRAGRAREGRRGA